MLIVKIHLPLLFQVAAHRFKISSFIIALHLMNTLKSHCSRMSLNRCTLLYHCGYDVKYIYMNNLHYKNAVGENPPHGTALLE
jgi:hypothetical protein